jgi:hypothetical protein
VEGVAGPSSKLKLKLGKLGELISGDRDKDRDSPFSPSIATHGVSVTPTAVGPEEEERRLRMVQAAGEEDAVSERLTQRKRRKRRTRRSSPSKPDSTSTSLEKLTDIRETEIRIETAPSVRPLRPTASA